MASKRRRRELRDHLRTAIVLQHLVFHEVGELSGIITRDGPAVPGDGWYEEILKVIDELAIDCGYDGVDLFESNVDYLDRLAENGDA